MGTAAGAALIVGAGGSGKSTSALWCIGSGLLYCGDEYALVAPESEPRVYSLYCSGKLEPFRLRNFPHLIGRVESQEVPEGEKALLFADRPEDGATRSLALRAVLVPRITGLRDTTVGSAPLRRRRCVRWRPARCSSCPMPAPQPQRCARWPPWWLDSPATP